MPLWKAHANLDLTIFVRIAQTLGINYRYVGEEPNSQVTGIYNEIMAKKLRKIRLHARLFLEKKQMVLSSALLLYEPPSKVVKWSC